MLFSSTDVPPDYLGTRGEGDRRKGERRKQPRSGPDRRKGERRRSALRSTLLAVATVALPHQVKPESLNPAWLRPPIPVVTTTIESVVAIPPSHAYDDYIREASTRFRVDATLIRSCLLYTSPSPRDRQKSRMPSSA